MKKKYQSFNEIQADLKKLYLEKEIAYEELKIVKRDFEDYLKPINWLHSTLKTISKYGVIFMIKKMFK